VVVLILALAAVALAGCSSSGLDPGLATNPELDPGTPVSGRATDFTLTDQFGRPVSLHSFRGKVVILAFNDPVCTTVCPLTTSAMLEAKALLGPAGSRVQLLGVGANPVATQVKWVRAYSQAHDMMHAWHFLNGPLHELKRVWRAYGIGAQIVHGQIDHTPALFVINARGGLSRLYLTQMSYTSVAQLGHLLAQSASNLLPGHPRVPPAGSYAPIPLTDPGTPVALPRAGGGTILLGPSRSAHLVLFFDTWDSEVTNLAGQLEALNQYQADAAADGLPSLTAVDEATVEPSPGALGRFLRGLRRPLTYPIAVDHSGRVADGYRVADEPYLELISASGQFLWYYDVSTGGWPSRRWLIHRIRAALARAPKPYPLGAGTELAGSPTALEGVHSQAGQLLGSGAALKARLGALHGYPVVINAWAAWCAPCQEEFPLFASASLRYGSRVAFLGADTDDSAGDARAFLEQHSVSYPSYQSSTNLLSSIAVIEGLPTTIFISPAGKVIDVHTGPYATEASLDADVVRYALAH
jgi:cytochrome oxidase Cu insertion factor (SCO1/SenC/PrrC family)/thiol-disulfide isomerase/thioredoxin